MPEFRNFTRARQFYEAKFKQAQPMHRGRWQGIDVSQRKEMRSYELLHESIIIHLGGIDSLEHWQEDVKPNLPWADDHFAERVCGVPLNPGKQWRNWPWASSADKHRTEGEMFNHTYMERLWGKYAGRVGPLVVPEDFVSDPSRELNRGARHVYGDLDDLIQELVDNPTSRQIAIPLFWPEDVGLDERKPCTMFYHFMVQKNQLDIWYPLRSCDFIRHWADDCYLAIRLLLWMIEKSGLKMSPGIFKMDIANFHIFENDYRKMYGSGQ